MDSLPATDKGFWEDARTQKVKLDELERMSSKHDQVVQRGQWFICAACKNKHTLPFSTEEFTIKEGKLAKVLD